MTIYVSHSSKFDYQNDLYAPLKASELAAKYTFIFPHEEGKEVTNSKEVIQSADIVLAEVSYPSTGQGIELGWADAFGKNIIAIYNKGSTPSPWLKNLCVAYEEYSGSAELTAKITQALLL